MILRPSADGAGKQEETKGSRLTGNGNPLHANPSGARTIPRGTENTDLRTCGGKPCAESVQSIARPLRGGSTCNGQERPACYRSPAGGLPERASS